MLYPKRSLNPVFVFNTGFVAVGCATVVEGELMYPACCPFNNVTPSMMK